MKKQKILGICGSLRNGRWGSGKEGLITEIKIKQSEDELFQFLKEEANLHLDNFVEAGRGEGKNFDEIYKGLKKMSGKAGLSNSEVGLSTALWAAHQEGADIEYLSLFEHFKTNSKVKDPELLKSKIMAADAFLIATPVYFGDRGSLTDRLVNFIRKDKELIQNIQGKLYAGISVGAKRNGGQETSLIYLMADMLDLGFLAVGNDNKTTSQYGGTLVAGDVGTSIQDQYGLNTSLGTGRRCARVLLKTSEGDRLKGKSKVIFLILQDKDAVAENRVTEYIQKYSSEIDATILNLTKENINACIACDICPTHVDIDEEYRCIIKSGKDSMSDLHLKLLGHDMIVPVVYSPKGKEGMSSSYQVFIERTRYIRRGDYIFSNQLVCPMVLEEVGGRGNYSMRLMTSFVRHHTVLSAAVQETLYSGETLNPLENEEKFKQALKQSRHLATGRLLLQSGQSQYNPVGYILSVDKEKEDELLDRRREMIENRVQKSVADANERLYNA